MSVDDAERPESLFTVTILEQLSTGRDMVATALKICRTVDTVDSLFYINI